MKDNANSDYLNEVIGKRISNIDGLEKESAEVKIEFTDNTYLLFYHEQECCEYVRLVDYELTTKDENYLVGGIVNDARQDINIEGDDYLAVDEFSSWTFYNINTSKGCINMRWLGESNGYYSEEVTVKLLNK